MLPRAGRAHAVSRHALLPVRRWALRLFTPARCHCTLDPGVQLPPACALARSRCAISIAPHRGPSLAILRTNDTAHRLFLRSQVHGGPPHITINSTPARYTARCAASRPVAQNPENGTVGALLAPVWAASPAPQALMLPRAGRAHAVSRHALLPVRRWALRLFTPARCHCTLDPGVQLPPACALARSRCAISIAPHRGPSLAILRTNDTAHRLFLRSQVHGGPPHIAVNSTPARCTARCAAPRPVPQY